jgi:hypothetical protein
MTTRPGSPKFHDLARMVVSDPYEKTYEIIDRKVISEIDQSGTTPLNLQVTLNVDLLTTAGLRSYFLHLFKIYSANFITLEIAENNVFTTKQYADFLSFCRDFRLRYTVISERISDLPYWEDLIPLIPRLELNFHRARHDQKTLLSLIELVEWRTELSVNIWSSPDQSADYILSEKLKEDKKIRNVNLITETPTQKPHFVITPECFP